MVIEQIKDVDAVGERFRSAGRMMPEGVEYVASWLEPSGSRCFQLMNAPDADAFRGWTQHWDDLMEFEIVPVLTSADFWKERAAKTPS